MPVCPEFAALLLRGSLGKIYRFSRRMQDWVEPTCKCSYKLDYGEKKGS